MTLRYPRSMVASPAHERLLQTIGVQLVDDLDVELADYARAWLADVHFERRDGNGARKLVEEALARYDERRAA